MSEPTDLNNNPPGGDILDNLLVKHDGPIGPVDPDTPAPQTSESTDTPDVIYDATGTNRFEFEVIGDDGERYDTAHVYKPVSDDRYIQWIDDFNIKATGADEIQEESRESDCKCWDDVIALVENIDVPEGTDFRTLIPPSEKSDGLKQYFAVAPVEPDEKKKGPRRLGTDVPKELTVITEAWFNGHITTQRHFLTPKTLELEKKFERIQSKRTKTEQTRGLRRKPKVEFVAQDDKLGKLYDEMKIRVEGFVGDVIPLRFKTTVMSYVFAPTLDPKLTAK